MIDSYRSYSHSSNNSTILHVTVFMWDTSCLSDFLTQPKTNVVALLKEMSTKFQQEAPLSSKASGDEDPHKLLASISSLQKEGEPLFR